MCIHIYILFVYTYIHIAEIVKSLLASPCKIAIERLLRNIFPEKSSTESDLPKVENTLTFENKVEILKFCLLLSLLWKMAIELTLENVCREESSTECDPNTVDVLKSLLAATFTVYYHCKADF